MSETAGIIRAYDALVGTGGVGTGIFFDLCGNETLGRTESRAGNLADRRDYCKLHIICHYVKRLLADSLLVVPIGCVGDDPSGQSVLDEMQHAGLDLRYMRKVNAAPTLFSVCFTYPDGDGGNMTSATSASAMLTTADVRRAEPLFRQYQGRGIALAAPEVPLSTRAELLDLATQYGFLRVASFVSSELTQVADSQLLRSVDLVALNLHEASVLCSLDEATPAEKVGEAISGLIRRTKPDLQAIITAGSSGSWIATSTSLTHTPVTSVDTRSTAGAGDAHLAGAIVGLVAGLDLGLANQLATTVSRLAVTSPHTIHPDLDAAMVEGALAELNLPLSDAVMNALPRRQPDQGISGIRSALSLSASSPRCEPEDF